MPTMPLTEEQRSEVIDKITQKKLILRELKSREYLRDLYKFNLDILHVANQGDLSPFHREMCEFIMDNEKVKRKLMLVPRGHLKSTLITVGYCLLRIAKDPNVRILIANATYDMACTFITMIKKHLQSNETFREYYGDMTTNAKRWSENVITVPTSAFTVKKEPTVTAYGIGGNLVSQHYDVIIMDDVVNRDLISTPEQIQKTIMFYKDSLDLIEPSTGEIIIVGTRWHQNDLYGWIMDETSKEEVYRNFDIMVRKAYDGDMETGEGFKALFPQKFTREVLQDLKKQKGPYEFAAQYENNCVPAETAKFKQEWFQMIGEDELKYRDIHYFTTIDPAIAQKEDSDKTAIVTIAVDQFNNWFVRSIEWGHFLPSDIINKIFENWELFHPKRIGIELTAYQKSLQYALKDEMRRRNIFLPLVELKANKNKGERIEGLIPRYANGTMFHLQQCPYRNILEEELTWYPRGKHDDIADALAYQLQIAYQTRKKETHWHGRSSMVGEADWDDDDDHKQKKKYLY